MVSVASSVAPFQKSTLAMVPSLSLAVAVMAMSPTGSTAALAGAVTATVGSALGMSWYTRT